MMQPTYEYVLLLVVPAHNYDIGTYNCCYYGGRGRVEFTPARRSGAPRARTRPRPLSARPQLVALRAVT